MHDFADRVEGDAAVPDAEDPRHPDAAFGSSRVAPLVHHARRPTLGQVDVLVDQDHEFVSGLGEAGVQSLGCAGTVAELQELVRAPRAEARRAQQIGLQFRSSLTHTTKVRGTSSVAAMSVCRSPTATMWRCGGGGEVADAHAEEFEQRGSGAQDVDVAARSAASVPVASAPASSVPVIGSVVSITCGAKPPSNRS